MPPLLPPPPRPIAFSRVPCARELLPRLEFNLALSPHPHTRRHTHTHTAGFSFINTLRVFARAVPATPRARARDLRKGAREPRGAVAIALAPRLRRQSSGVAGEDGEGGRKKNAGQRDGAGAAMMAEGKDALSLAYPPPGGYISPGSWLLCAARLRRALAIWISRCGNSPRGAERESLHSS